MRRTVVNPASDEAKNNDSVAAKPPMIWRGSGSAVPARGRVTASLLPLTIDHAGLLSE
jgi:hypothetical protein